MRLHVILRRSVKLLQMISQIKLEGKWKDIGLVMRTFSPDVMQFER